MREHFSIWEKSNVGNKANRSAIIGWAHRQLITFELVLVFLGSLFVTNFRFGQSTFDSLTEYPGFPKVFIYPLIWYYFLSQTHSWDRSIFYQSNDYYIRVLKAGSMSLVTFAAIAYLLRYPISRIWVIANVIFIMFLLLLSRFLLRRIYHLRLDIDGDLPYLYVGTEESLELTSREFQSIYGFSPRFIPFEPPATQESDIWLAQYEAAIFKHKVYGVIIGVGVIQDAALLRQLSDLQRSQVIDFLLATRIGAIAGRFEVLDSPTIVRVRESSIVTSGAVLKRFFDVFFSLIALLLLLPLFIVVAILIKLTSKGPVFYIDQRVGKDGMLFTFPKFRSMYQGSDSDRLSVLGRPDSSMSQRYKNDPRITPLGRFLRRWSIDETPQFWSVLAGKMSVVGPRPILTEELVQIPSNYQLRFLAKPGLTGLWQVTGRKEVAWEDRMVRDISYIDSWSFSKDLVLIGKTIAAVVKGEGAH